MSLAASFLNHPDNLDVCALGELLIDFASLSSDEDGYPVMAAHPGGAPANFLAALQKRGCTTALLAKVGADAFGDRLIHTVKQAGIHADGIIQDPDTFTTLAFVTFDDKGERSFSFARKPGADTRLSKEELELPLIEKARDFHFGTLSLCADPAKEATLEAVKKAKEAGCWISFDPNLRIPLWSDLDEAKKQILWGLSQADIVKISDEETDFLFGDISPEEAADRIHSMGASVVFVTLGKKGAYYSSKAGNGYVSCPEGIQAIDTTGAGDIFGGTALATLLNTHKALDDLAKEDIEEAARQGSITASLSTLKQGGISSVPSEKEVEAFIHASAE